MKGLWLNDAPINDDLLSTIHSQNLIDDIEVLCLDNCRITNELVQEIAARVMKKEESVSFFCSNCLHDKLTS